MSRKYLLSVVLSFFLYLVFTPISLGVYEETNVSKPEYVPNEIVVKYKSGQSPVELKNQSTALSTTSSQKATALEEYNQAKQLNASLGIINTDSPAPVAEGVVLYETNGAIDVVDAVSRLYQDSSVEYAEPNYYYYSMVTPNDPLYSQQWGLAKINLPRAWDLTKGSTSVKVAVIDSGIASNHPDFAGRIVEEKGFGGCSPGGDIPGHGTHVAGTIGATTNNATGVTGVSWLTGIMALRASCDARGSFSLVSVAQAIDYATNNGAKVINMSLGGPGGSQTLSSAITRSVNRGVTIVAASGNSGPGTADRHHPGSLPNVISVGATTSSDQIARFSSTGSSVDVSAPGADIASTFPQNQYKSLSGTSMASPHVAGVVALMYALNPSISPSEVKSILENTAVDLGTPGRDTTFGAGRIDAYAALARVGGGSNLPTPTSIAGPSQTPSSPNPTSSTGPLPTTPGCPAGDYDCSGTIDKDDYNKWLADFIAGNSQLSKFESWRKAIYRRS